MREMKFKVWDSVLKRWLKTDEVKISIDGGVEVKTTGSLSDFGRIVHPLRCTGLKDVDNQEVYEGDILENIDTKAYYPVDFLYGSFHWYTAPFPMMNQNEECFLKHKIIGNIYENPELVK